MRSGWWFLVKIQGITVELNGDATKLQTAFKGINTEIRNQWLDSLNRVCIIYTVDNNYDNSFC